MERVLPDWTRPLLLHGTLTLGPLSPVNKETETDMKIDMDPERQTWSQTETIKRILFIRINWDC